jgi:hypothetical protein
MVVALIEVVPAKVHTAGFSLAYSLATALFGGFTPAVSAAFIEWTGDKAAPGLWMSFAAACGLFATLFLYRRRAVGARALMAGPEAECSAAPPPARHIWGSSHLRRLEHFPEKWTPVFR